ncbi:MAG: GNAT family N-acetyltransferase [Chthoniobacterales bacterium]
MELIRFAPEYQNSILTLHRKAMSGFTTGMGQHEEEADLTAIEQVYFRDGEFLVGLIDGKVVAMGGFKQKSPTTAELKRIRIEPELQGKGYGTQLLQELERRAAERGFSTLWLETARARSRTLAFYDRHGYKQVGDGSYGAVEVVAYSKQLDSETRQVGEKGDSVSQTSNAR